MKNDNVKWVEFSVYPDTTSNVIAKAALIDGELDVKVVTKVAKGDYYSVLNAATEEATEKIFPILSLNDNVEPNNEEVVYGFDEFESVWIQVQFRHDRKKFYDYPYTGSCYPNTRMFKYRKIN